MEINLVVNQKVKTMNNEIDKETKKRFESMKTSDLIDELDTPMDDSETDIFWEVLSEREFYKYIMETIQDLNTQVEGQQKAIGKLKKHKHDAQGNCLGPL